MRWINQWAAALLGAWLACGPLSAAMTDRYITGALFRISADETADFWLNGHFLFRQGYTGLEGGPQTKVAIPAHLCYFQRRNTLAIRVMSPAHPAVGVAYVLRLLFSDGSSQIFSSGEVEQHKALYLRDDQEPYGWQAPGFDDSGWGAAFDTGHVPYAALLPDPDGNQLPFLSASGADNAVKEPGERHLFRLQFVLDALPSPHCRTQEAFPTPTPFVSFPAAALPTPTALPSALAAGPGPLVVRDSSEPPTPGPTDPESPVPPVTALGAPGPAPPALQGGGALQPASSFYVSLADGAGYYELSIVDEKGREVRRILGKDSTGAEEAWIQWDGKDDAGKGVPVGNYSLVYSKDGKVLRKMALPVD